VELKSSPPQIYEGPPPHEARPVNNFSPFFLPLLSELADSGRILLSQGFFAESRLLEQLSPPPSLNVFSAAINQHGLLGFLQSVGQ